MSLNYTLFLEEAEKNSFNKELKKRLKHTISKYDLAVEAGKQQFHNLNLAKKRAGAIRFKAINNLDKYLIEFEANFIKKGGKVLWAQNPEEAVTEIIKIISKSSNKSVVKGKTSVGEEILINEGLRKENISVTETDLGEYIQELAGEPPYHFVTPAMHKSVEEISSLLEVKKKMSPTASPSAITAFVREEIREKFTSAGIGITGANFLLSDTGSISITENEANASLSFSFPKVHIVIAGIEKVLPSLSDLDLFLPLLATHGTGQPLTVYNTIINGPRQINEIDGPQEMYVVLLDNNRSSILARPEQRRSLSCIRCGACLSACPVFQNVGGHTYNTTYSGPIGSIISPFIEGKESFKHLSYASSICGKCTEVCPVDIDLHKLLLFNRRDFKEEGLNSKKENWTMFFWKNAMLKRSKMEKGGASLKNFMLKQFFKKSWGDRRDMPVIAAKSFNQMWRERKGIKG